MQGVWALPALALYAWMGAADVGGWMVFQRTFDSPFIIIGAGGHGAGVAEVLAASGARVEAFVDEGKAGSGTRLGIPVL